MDSTDPKRYWPSHQPSAASSSLALELRFTGHGVDKYPSKSHARRLAAQLAASSGLIVISGAPSTLYCNSDNPIPFRQDRYFFYLTGCNEPNCHLTYELTHDLLTLWLPPIDEKRVVWSGRGSTVEEALERYDVDEARYCGPSDALPHMDLERYIAAAGYRGEILVLGNAHVGSEFEGGKRWQALKSALNACRVVKDSHEIALIRRANEITAAAHTAVLQNLHSFTNEADVEATYVAVCIAKHAKEQAYSPIAGSGPNASVLHYVSNNEDLGRRQMMVLDAGCEVSCYASDVTRTLPLNARNPGHWPSEEAEKVYALVEKVQEACIKQMRPGKQFIEIARLAQHMTLDGLLKLGILKGEREEIALAGTVAGFFPHGLGHHLGLEVHDVSPDPPPPATSSHGASTQAATALPSLPLPPTFDFASSSSLHSASAPMLEPGMVVTIEPGVYFNHFLLEKFFLSNPDHRQYIDKNVLDSYWKVGGVRIEDDILITESGYENLTTAPKGEAMLKVIREGAANGLGSSSRAR